MLPIYWALVHTWTSMISMEIIHTYASAQCRIWSEFCFSGNSSWQIDFRSHFDFSSSFVLFVFIHWSILCVSIFRRIVLFVCILFIEIHVVFALQFNTWFVIHFSTDFVFVFLFDICCVNLVEIACLFYLTNLHDLLKIFTKKETTEKLLYRDFFSLLWNMIFFLIDKNWSFFVCLDFFSVLCFFFTLDH